MGSTKGIKKQIFQVQVSYHSPFWMVDMCVCVHATPSVAHQSRPPDPCTLHQDPHAMVAWWLMATMSSVQDQSVAPGNTQLSAVVSVLGSCSCNPTLGLIPIHSWHNMWLKIIKNRCLWMIRWPWVVYVCMSLSRKSAFCCNKRQAQFCDETRRTIS